MFNNSKNNETKERILFVARDLFITNGYVNTSVRDIAAAADTNVAMVNYYFNSKYDLFEIIFEEALNVLLDRILSVINSDKPIFDLLASWIDSYYETLLEYPQIPIFILNAVNQNPDRLVEIVRKRQPYEIFLKISGLLEKEVEKGVIRETPSLDFLLNILSLCVFPFIFGTMATKVAGRTTEEYAQVLSEHKEYVKQFVINALKP
ncbi:TetR/AcrR family transcriptional regulator [Bacteroides sp. OttesenSCG-928-D19]|nr:TetR/AcrR family transcriptional regulator [Bacteroides sp. OttesenSCG-928-D19]